MHGSVHWATCLIAGVVTVLNAGCSQPGQYGSGSGSFAAAQRAGPASSHDYAAASAAAAAGDYPEALRLFHKIDAQGLSGAPLDFRRAMQFRNELAGAQEQIGEFYEKGLGVQQSYPDAAAWYRKAMGAGSLGNPSFEPMAVQARLRLGFLYANGLGVPRDRLMAKSLFLSSQAAESNHLVSLLDQGLLPRSMDDLSPGYVASADAKIASENANRYNDPRGYTALKNGDDYWTQVQTSCRGGMLCQIAGYGNVAENYHLAQLYNAVPDNRIGEIKARLGVACSYLNGMALSDPTTTSQVLSNGPPIEKICEQAPR